MIKTAEPVNIRGILQSKGQMTADEFGQLRRAIASDQVITTRQEIESLLREIEAGGASSQSVRAGIGAYLLAQHGVAERLLSGATTDNVALYVHGMVCLSLEKWKEAEAKFSAAAKAGYDAVECTLKRAGAIRLQGRLDDAEAALKQAGMERARHADYSYQLGCILSDRGDSDRAIEHFERAVDMDPHHSQALFRLAGENARYGNDNEAIRLYEQGLSKAPFYVGGLLNLGLLYEDKGNYSAAAFCFRRVLQHDQNHARALMYMKDIEATSEMYYDDDMAKNEAPLVEIRDLMQAHGLRIGQNLAPVKPKEPGGNWQGAGTYAILPTDLSPQEQAMLARSVSDLNLSVRARKCMARLGITTLSELVQRTPDELLATKNFGVTSLNEIRQQLGEISLKLRND